MIRKDDHITAKKIVWKKSDLDSININPSWSRRQVVLNFVHCTKLILIDKFTGVPFRCNQQDVNIFHKFTILFIVERVLNLQENILSGPD